jgi:hypothetical protein
MATQEIVLGTDSWTFWTGNDQQPWLDDPREAKVFTSRSIWKSPPSSYMSEIPKSRG